jgi:hypothetical protein
VILKKSPISIISLICFQLNRVENGNGDISPEVHFENSKVIIL